ncbi:bifunctional serine/threonine-protein kinase/formylglycine-generating enzyme family protein [Luteimonas sp. MHLX1A]|uniref:bifunctional serine/threonine-protein kinase/formylglycine-generating enzyme family protein n=1 Tax=Alterluteimonas muca TaxID=2878684 RepID=UPI001E4A1820|nr:bifunctional serine/threonine-protein kinase/formylglycine-generating enzyme family protein [Luteimonas sp. MHLX1A]MCD9047063.1 protein kinase [Luteimonas sp. MHLX1A]
MQDRSTFHDAATPLPEVAGYRVLRRIADGGMSTVYLARQESLGRDVAIKVMRPEALGDEVSRRRFENEARTIGRLDHPHIVGIHQIGRTADDRPFFVMPHMTRGHLGQRDLAGDEARIREILRALLSALAYAHARGVIHRDVKAENVLFDDADRPLLADFGIALRRGYGSRVTSAGLALGSTAYMAPEQARGEEVDHRADLYAMGVLTWEMLTGRLPFEAQDALSMAVMHAQDPIPRLPPHLRHWQKFIDRSMAKYPLKRYHDAGDMLLALERIPRGPQRSFSPRDAAAAGAARMRELPRGAWIVLALLLAAGLGFGLRHGDDSARGFFRASQPQPATDSVAPGDAAVIENPDDALLRAAPESEASTLMEDARRQLQQRRLVSPAGDNAYDSLVAAARIAPDHLELPQLSAQLVRALANDALRATKNGNDADARAQFERIATLVQATGPAGDDLTNELQRDVTAALTTRIEAAARRFDRDAARRAVALAAPANLDTAARERLRRQAEAVPAVGGVLTGDPARMTVVRSGDGAYALTRRHISRSDYARFAEATGRPATLCRERASVLRVIARRDWTDPGFEQGTADPVVCVSWEDAQAFAQWLGARNGHRYRLPTTVEASGSAAAAGSRAVAEWLLDCEGDCVRRKVRGSSWRRDEDSRARDGGRGYDDVGFRLVREP